MNIIEDFPTENCRALITDTEYTPELLQANQDFIFVLDETRTDQKNIFTITTKHESPDSAMKDCSRDNTTIMYDLTQLQQLYLSGKTIVFPAAGLGLNLAKQAPQLYHDMNVFIRHTFFTGDEIDAGDNH